MGRALLFGVAMRNGSAMAVWWVMWWVLWKALSGRVEVVADYVVG